jgi:hypothetical protein
MIQSGTVTAGATPAQQRPQSEDWGRCCAQQHSLLLHQRLKLGARRTHVFLRRQHVQRALLD